MSKAKPKVSKSVPTAPQKLTPDLDQLPAVANGKPEPMPVPPEVLDALDQSVDLAMGLDNLFYCIACSDDGLEREGARALQVISEKLTSDMNLVDDFFNPKEQ